MAAIWAINFSVVKYGTAKFDPVAFMTLRIAVSAVLLAAIALLRNPPKLSRETWLRLLLLGVVGHGIYQYFFVIGVSRTRAGNAALIVASAPAFIAIASRLRGLEKVRRLTLAGIGLSVIGVAVVILGSTRPGSAEGSSVTGTVLVFCGVLAWTVFTVGLQPFTRVVQSTQLAAITIIGGAVPLVLITLPVLLAQDYRAVGLGGWIALGYSSVLSTVVGYFLWYYGLKKIGATRTSAYTNLQPIIALVFAWIFLKEAPTAWQIVGTGTIVSGIFLTRA
jgi:drug/metabolite transporter (DMT)-like permease